MKIQRKNSGFTLVEILIVVIILGILAAIVIPQFTEASEEARESTLTSNLQVLRSQIGLYKIQHRDVYPGDADGDSATDADVNAADFVLDLTTRTHEDGTTYAAGDTGVAYGPYMQALPSNPFVALDPTVAANMVTVGATPATGSNLTHWNFDQLTGAVTAMDSGATSDGTLHLEL